MHLSGELPEKRVSAKAISILMLKSKDELFALIVKPTVIEVERYLSMMKHPDQMEEESYTFDYHLKIY